MPWHDTVSTLYTYMHLLPLAIPVATKPTNHIQQGLEREYDRLLSEHDKLRRDYEQATGGRLGGAKKAE